MYFQGTHTRYATLFETIYQFYREQKAPLNPPRRQVAGCVAAITGSGAWSLLVCLVKRPELLRSEITTRSGQTKKTQKETNNKVLVRTDRE